MGMLCSNQPDWLRVTEKWSVFPGQQKVSINLRFCSAIALWCLQNLHLNYVSNLYKSIKIPLKNTQFQANEIKNDLTLLQFAWTSVYIDFHFIISMVRSNDPNWKCDRNKKKNCMIYKKICIISVMAQLSNFYYKSNKKMANYKFQKTAMHMKFEWFSHDALHHLLSVRQSASRNYILRFQ